MGIDIERSQTRCLVGDFETLMTDCCALSWGAGIRCEVGEETKKQVQDTSRFGKAPGPCPVGLGGS